MSSVKETKELVIGLNEVALHLIKIFKKGVSLDAALELWRLFEEDDDLKLKVAAAYENYRAIPTELEAIDFKGSIELMYTQLYYIPELLEVIKKDDRVPGPIEVPKSLPVPDAVSDDTTISKPALGGAGESTFRG